MHRGGGSVGGRRGTNMVLYLPKAEENNSFDADKLCQWCMRLQFFGENMVEDNQGIHGQGKGQIENDGECPTEPAGIHPNNLQCYHQDRTYRTDDNKLPRPGFEKSQRLVIQMCLSRLHISRKELFLDTDSKSTTQLKHM